MLYICKIYLLNSPMKEEILKKPNTSREAYKGIDIWINVDNYVGSFSEVFCKMFMVRILNSQKLNE